MSLELHCKRLFLPCLGGSPHTQSYHAASFLFLLVSNSRALEWPWFHNSQHITGGAPTPYDIPA